MRSSSNRKEGFRVASPLSPRTVEATESALGLLPSIALSSAQFLLILKVVRWRSLTAADRSGAPSQLLRESNQQRKHNSGKGCAGRAHVGQHARSGIVSSHFRNRGPLPSGAGRTQAETGEVHIYLDHAADVTWSCPECSAPSPLYDHQPERCWRHLDTCGYRTILHANPPEQYRLRVSRWL